MRHQQGRADAQWTAAERRRGWWPGEGEEHAPLVPVCPGVLGRSTVDAAVDAGVDVDVTLL